MFGAKRLSGMYDDTGEGIRDVTLETDNQYLRW